MGNIPAIVLPASRVDIGHCVIINDCDCPESLTVSVVTEATPERVVARYLSKQIDMVECWSSRPDEVTPVELFGVRVRYDPTFGLYWCQPDESLTASAVYPDGKPRPWQERCEPIRRYAKLVPLKLAMRKRGTMDRISASISLDAFIFNGAPPQLPDP